MQSLARRGGGYCEILEGKERSKWKGRVASLLDRCLEPALEAVELTWKMYNSGDTVTQAPYTITSLFNRNRQV